MSRYFTSVADHLDNSSPPLTATPFSMSAWVKFFTPTTLQQILSICTSGSNNNRWSIGISAGNAAQAATRSTSSRTGVSGILLPLNAWCLVTGTYGASDTYRTGWANGGNPGQDIFTQAITTPNAVRVSADGSGGNPLLGAYVAHIGVWGIELQNIDVQALFTNPPSYVQPSSLLEYWSLNGNVSPEPSFGTTPHNLIVTGTTFSPDDPFYNPPTLLGQAVF